MSEKLTKKWTVVYTISMFTAPGSYVALNIINNKELLPWLRPEMVPYFGFPLLVILCASCLFGARGLINILGELNGKWKTFNELEKKYKEAKEQEENETPPKI